jgi:hypothetical protein
MMMWTVNKFDLVGQEEMIKRKGNRQEITLEGGTK